jgi:hypothetical protein
MRAALSEITGCRLLPGVGTYNSGLISILDADAGRCLLHPWDWLVGQDAIALITTGFGDVFFWRQGFGVGFLEVQRQTAEFVDNDVDWVTNEFLVKSEIIEAVLKRRRFQELVRTKKANSSTPMCSYCSRGRC